MRRFGAVAYAELGDELFDGDLVDGDTVTLLNPTKPTPGPDDDCAPPPYGRKTAAVEWDAESCASHQSLVRHEYQRKSRRRSEEDLFLYE